MENFIDNLIDALKDLELIIGVIIGFCSSIILDVKSSINKYYEDITVYYNLIEELYIDVRFNDKDIIDVVNEIKNDKEKYRIIPNYFKYAIKIKDVKSIEAIIVNNYYRKINLNMNIIQTKSVTLVLHVLFSIIAISVFMGITTLMPIAVFFMLIDYLNGKIYKLLLIVILIVLSYIYIFYIHPIITRKALAMILDITIEKDTEKNYKSILEENKKKYKNRNIRLKV